MDNLIIEEKLSEADMEAEATSVRLSSDEVFGRVKMTFSELWQSISEEDREWGDSSRDIRDYIWIILNIFYITVQNIQ